MTVNDVVVVFRELGPTVGLFVLVIWLVALHVRRARGDK